MATKKKTTTKRARGNGGSLVELLSRRLEKMRQEVERLRIREALHAGGSDPDTSAAIAQGMALQLVEEALALASALHHEETPDDPASAFWQATTTDIEGALLALQRPMGRTKAGRRYLALATIHEQVEELYDQWQRHEDERQARQIPESAVYETPVVFPVAQRPAAGHAWFNETPAYTLVVRVEAAILACLPSSLTQATFNRVNNDPERQAQKCAAQVFQYWKVSGKWSAVNGLLAVWGLDVKEPEGPRVSGQKHPLAEEWKKLQKKPPKAFPKPRTSGESE